MRKTLLCLAAVAAVSGCPVDFDPAAPPVDPGVFEEPNVASHPDATLLIPIFDPIDAGIAADDAAPPDASALAPDPPARAPDAAQPRFRDAAEPDEDASEPPPPRPDASAPPPPPPRPDASAPPPPDAGQSPSDAGCFGRGHGRGHSHGNGGCNGQGNGNGDGRGRQRDEQP